MWKHGRVRCFEYPFGSQRARPTLASSALKRYHRLMMNEWSDRESDPERPVSVWDFGGDILLGAVILVLLYQQAE